MSVVGRTGILNDDDPKAEVYCTRCGSEYAHVGLAAGNHNRFDMLADQEFVKTFGVAMQIDIGRILPS